MNRLAYPLSLAHLSKILNKSTELDQLSKDQIFRFTSVGFVLKSTDTYIELMDGTANVTFDLDYSALYYAPKSVVRLHYLISKSLQVRVIFIEKINYGEQMMVHMIGALKVASTYHQEKTAQPGEFNNFFDGVGEVR